MTIRDFKLPDLGEGLEEGDIVSWRVAVGETIELNQTVAEVETAKAVVEVPSPFAGTVVERIGEEGETLAVGSVFLRIDEAGAAADGGGAADGAPAAAPGAAADGTPEGDLVPEGQTSAPASVLDADEEPQPLVGYGQRDGGGRRRRRRGPSPVETLVGPSRVLAKPPVRKLAKDLGVDLAAVAPGSGPDGVITRDDVHAAADGAPPVAAAASAAAPAQGAPARTEGAASPGAADTAPTPAPSPGRAVADGVVGFRGRRPGEVEQVAGIRKRIIQKMEHSRRTIPHALCATDADVTGLWELREDLTAQARAQGHDVRITPYTLVMRATVVALRRFPTLNAVYDAEAGEIRLLEHIHLGVAVDTDRGLMVANVKDAHTKSLLQISAEAAALAQRCRDGSATPADLTGGTFTTDNYGYFGNDDGNPIINAPEVGILGISAMKPRPWVVPSRSGGDPMSGGVVPRRVCRFQLAFDHRVCDGGEAGRFVTYVAELCEEPSRLLLHA